MTRLILDRTPALPYVAPILDEDQQRVVNHRHGAMRVLAGPGTGKTTTLVAAMAARLSGPDALHPNQVLGLTFGRRAAIDWRDQVTAAVGGGVVPAVSTFHSFCYSLIRQFQSDEAYISATRLLSGPEQQVRSRQLFADAIADQRLNWPEELMPAVGTRGLAEEIRAVMSRTRSHIMDPEDLVELGKSTGRQTWTSIGVFMDEYLDVLDAEGVLDYSELIHRAVLLSRRSDVQEYLHKTFRAIYVDEYQDTDPGQVALLKALVNSDSALVVVGDIDQAIYGFRGADETCIRNFEDEFKPIFANPVEHVVLTTCRRFGKQIRGAARAVIGDRTPAGFNETLIKTHRNLNCVSENFGEVMIRTFDSPGAEASHIADAIARAHASSNLQWSDFAVIVRSAVVSIPTIYRAFVAAGIPVEVAADEIPLHQDPAVSPLVTALRIIDNPKHATVDVVADLLTGPLAAIDPVDLRRFGSYLRKADRTVEHAPRPALVLIGETLLDPKLLLDVPPGKHDSVVAAIEKIGSVINQARNQMQSGASPHEVLWSIWQGTSWPTRLQERALGFGTQSTRAHRDLDAICSLFDLANRFVARGRGKDLTNFLDEIEAQEIPAEALAENDVRNDSVRLLTAHRSKGLQWKYVVVAGAQEELWPDLRQQQSLLQSDRIGPNIELMPLTMSELLAQERRLFYVALTRAMQTLLITATDTSIRDDGVSPTRFINDIVTAMPDVVIEHTSGRPKRPLSPDGVIANLRRTLSSKDSSQALKQAAANQLAQLLNRHRTLFSHADPDKWWGVLDSTQNLLPINTQVSISASGVTAIEHCPAQWFLERKLNALSQSATPMIFGNALHAIAQGLSSGELAYDITAIDDQLDRLWPGMGYEAEWESSRERNAAHDASVRLLTWMLDHKDQTSITESDLSWETKVAVEEPDGSTREVDLAIRGRADRIEFTEDGIMIFDFKTSKDAKKPKDLFKDIQLALYAFLLDHGSFTKDDLVISREPGQAVKGAALVQLRVGEKDNSDLALVQQVGPDTHDENSPTSLEQRLGQAALVVLDERYEARYEEQKCKLCKVRTLCPATPEGRQVLS
jgi:superfamily I DNA/RNA helicase/RecB family exonuclease